MKDNLFVVILKYIVPIEQIDALRPEHLKFLDIHYASGNFIVSGTQAPRTGGVIVAKCRSKSTLEKILNNDPFRVNKLAEYTIYEFTPTKHIDELTTIL